MIPFCDCFHKPDYEGGKPLGAEDDGTLAWSIHEYEVLSSEQVYVEVARHRGQCLLQPDMFAGSRPRGDEVRRSRAGTKRGGGAALHMKRLPARGIEEFNL